MTGSETSPFLARMLHWSDKQSSCFEITGRRDDRVHGQKATETSRTCGPFAESTQSTLSASRGRPGDRPYGAAGPRESVRDPE
jgi:hypothetical protein